MRDSEMAKLLALAATVDNRIVTREMVGGWMASIGDLDFDACVAALWEHRRSSTDYLQPAHIAALVREGSVTAEPLEAERVAFRAFVVYTGADPEVAARHWNDPVWRADALSVARRAHFEAAIEGASA